MTDHDKQEIENLKAYKEAYKKEMKLNLSKKERTERFIASFRGNQNDKETVKRKK